MKLSFRNRIATYYLAATAIVMAIVFGVVYLIVQETVYANLDRDLSFEAEKHTKEIGISGDSLFFLNMAEWEEHEHREVQVNPVFIQLIDREGRPMDKSPNLKGLTLPFVRSNPAGDHFDTELNQRAIRQVQLPVGEGGPAVGYIVAAMSLESSLMVLRNLRSVLLLLFPVVLVGLFLTSRYLAGKNIAPIRDITDTTNRITRSNLSERVGLPAHEDELYDLGSSINGLLERIEQAIQRERQFTSDASHELRTPLAALRGTLEVLVRKPRSQAEYEEKIAYSLGEIDRMGSIVEQLLLLARFEGSEGAAVEDPVPLGRVLTAALDRYERKIAAKGLLVDWEPGEEDAALVQPYQANLILDNLLSNAVKYTPEGGRIWISFLENKEGHVLVLRDSGIGIAAQDLDRVFAPFFRSEALAHRHISGNGLGLSIAKKAADSIGARLEVESEKGEGCTFRVIFRKS